MFPQRPTAPAGGGLTVNTSSANSIFGNSTPAASAPGGTSTPGNMFGGFGGGASAATAKPQTGNPFSLGGSTSQPQQSGNSLFGLGSGTTTSAPAQPGSMFGGNTQTAAPAAGASLFGRTGTTNSQQPQSGLGGTQQPGGNSLFGGPKLGTPAQSSMNVSQQQGPTLSLFGNQNAASRPDQRTGPTVVPGVKIDISNLAPTTKFESCSDELKKEIEAIDTFILNQVRMCNEVSDLLPTISAQGTLIPNDVEFVQGKLDTLQEALENDASGIDHARNLAKQDEAEAKLAFRTLDTLLLPPQYQPGPGERWWASNQQQQSISKYSLRSALGIRQGTLALPEETETDSGPGGPSNLVDYFSHRADEMDAIVGEYRKTVRAVEEHLHGVEYNLQRKINDAVSSRNREGSTALRPASQARELAATLGDVETAILGVANRVGGVKEDVQELALGPLGANGAGISNGWQSRAF